MELPPLSTPSLARLQRLEAGFFEPFEDTSNFFRGQLRSLLRKTKLSGTRRGGIEEARVNAQILDYLCRIVVAFELAKADDIDSAGNHWRESIQKPVLAWIEYGPALWCSTIEGLGPLPSVLEGRPWDVQAWYRHVRDHYRRRFLHFRQGMESKVVLLRSMLETELESVGAIQRHVSLLRQLDDEESLREWSKLAVGLLCKVPDVQLGDARTLYRRSVRRQRESRPPQSPQQPLERDGGLPRLAERGRGGERDAGGWSGENDAGPPGRPARIILSPVARPQKDNPLTDDAVSLEKLIKLPPLVMSAMVKAKRRFQYTLRSEPGGCPWRRLQPLSRMRRLSVYVCLASPFVLGGVAMLWGRRRKQLQQYSQTLALALGAFYREHLAEPLRAIVDELFFAQRTPITDVSALQAEKTALQSMLDTFYKEMEGELSDEDRRKRVDAVDMSLVTAAYERSMVTNYNAARSMVTGELVRTLLIQMQFLKLEMMELMRATETLMNENEINMRLMATVPALLLGGAVFWALKRVYYALEMRRSRPQMVAYLSRLVLDIERFLTLRSGPTLQHVRLASSDDPNRPITTGPVSPATENAYDDGWLGASSDDESLSPKSASGDDAARGDSHHPPFLDTRTGSFFIESDAQPYAAMLPRVKPKGRRRAPRALDGNHESVADYSPWRRVLRARDTGKLLLMASRLSQALRDNRGRFSSAELVSMQEDLDTLVGDRGPLTVGQQCSIIQRMSRSYKSLNSVSHSSWLG